MIQLDHQRYNVPGIILSVSDGVDAPVRHYTSGFADIEKQIPLDDYRALIPCGVITRTFTAAILYDLVETHGINMDEPLGQLALRYQQDRGLLMLLLDPYPFLKPLTIRALLTNRSSLPAFDKTMAYIDTFLAKPRKKWQVENYFDALSGSDVRYQRGYDPTLRGDSGTHFLVAGLVAEAVSGQSIAELMKACFDSSGLSDTHYLPYGVVDRRLLPHMLHGYLPISHPYATAFNRQRVLHYNDNKELQVYDVTGAYCLNGMGNGAVVSTTADMIRWLQRLMANQSVVLKTGYDNGWAGNSLGFGLFVTHFAKKNRTMALAVNVSRQHLHFSDDDLVKYVTKQLC